MEESSSVHSHESDKGAEVQQLSSALVAQYESADQGKGTDEQNVVSGDAVLPFYNTEKGFRDCIIASHSVKQSSRSELRAHSGADVGHQQGEVHEMKKR